MSIKVYWVELDSDEQHLELLCRTSLVLDQKCPAYLYAADVLRHTCGIAMAAYAWQSRYPQLALPEITRSRNGKPCFILSGVKSKFSFNISHSGSIVICAAGESEVGIDVEKIGICPLEIVARYFSSTEQDMFLACDVTEWDRLFYRIWTRKECQLKATGQGLAGLTELVRQSDTRKWEVTELSLRPDYAVAICHVPTEHVTIIQVEMDELFSFCNGICREEY